MSKSSPYLLAEPRTVGMVNPARVALFLIGWLLCSTPAAFAATPAEAFDTQGHRGARGLAPENTLPAFARALSIGVSTLELDVGLTADRKLVVIHDRKVNPSLVRDTEGAWLPDKGPAVFELELAELRRFDVGRINPESDYASRFPEQIPVDGTTIPTLEEVVDLTRRAGNTNVRFNVETKISPLEPETTADPVEFADRLAEELIRLGIADRAIVQSFDWRTLQRLEKTHPALTSAYLTAEREWLDNIGRAKGGSPWLAGFDVAAYDGSVPRTVRAAGGDIWSPYHGDLREEQIAEAHALGLKVIVWTVNDPADMERFIDWGVDGIISDYPDRLRRVAANERLALPEPTPVTP